MADKITNHHERAVELLIGQYKGKPTLEGLIAVLSNRSQEIEDVAFELILERSVNTATGAQLDGLGAIVGEKRRGRGDADYRTAISLRIKINVSSGQPETLISVLAAATNADRIKYQEASPACVLLHYFGGTIPDNLIANMEKVRAAGVTLAISTSTDQTPLATEGDPDGLGFSDVGFENGGTISEVFQA